MFDLTCRQAEEEWNKTDVLGFENPGLIKRICVWVLTQCSMNVYTDFISGISQNPRKARIPRTRYRGARL